MRKVVKQDYSEVFCPRFSDNSLVILYSHRVPLNYNYQQFYLLLYNTNIFFIPKRYFKILFMDHDKVQETNPSQNEDVTLIRRILSGDSVAHDILLKKYWKQLYFEALGYVHEHAAAEDMVQQANLKIYLNLGKLQDPAKFHYWAINIIRNVCLSHIHKQKRESESIKNYADAVQIQHQPGGELGEVLEDIDRHKQQESIMKVIPQLPRKYHKIAIYYFSDGYTCTEIAAKLRLPMGTVKVRLQRIKKKLRHLLQGKL